MRQKLTNEEIDNRLIKNNRNIVRVDNYPGSNLIKIKWKCIIDEHIWEASTANILNKKGCPKCSGNLPLSNNEIDNRMNGRDIKRISDYPGKTNIKMKWKCLVDGYEWEATSNDVCGGRGCPKCAGNLRLNNQEIDARLNSRKIMRISDYPGKTNIKMKWKCLVDGYEWEATASNLFHPKYPTGCPKCKKKSEMKVEEILKSNDANNKYKKQICRDKIVKEYCNKLNIKLLEIPYWMAWEEINNIIRRECV